MERELQGRVSVCGLLVQEEELYTISEKVGSVFQNPRSQFFCLDTTSEVAFGCENMGLPEREIRERIEKVTSELHLEHGEVEECYPLRRREQERFRQQFAF